MNLGLTIAGWGRGAAPNRLQLEPYLTTDRPVFIKASPEALSFPAPTTAICLTPTINPLDGLADRYQSLIDTLLASQPAALLVPGHPLIDEAVTPLIQQAATAAAIPVTLEDAESCLSDTLQRLGISAGAGLQILDATLLASYHLPPLEPHRPLLVTGLYHPQLLEPVRRALLTLYRPQTTLCGLAAAGPNTTTLRDLTSACEQLFIPAQPDQLGLTRFQETIAHLRAPNGCPWDRKQTHKSLRPYLLEETYEVLAALDAGEMDELAEELGDLLLQIILHAQIATEAGTFRMSDIVNQIDSKIVRRHPHVFGDLSLDDAEAVKATWARIKAQEKAEKGLPLNDLPSVLDSVDLTLPALAQALDISRKAVSVGFEWSDVNGVLRKLTEEAHEIAAAATPHEVEGEIGDFLFTAVNLARKLDVDAETALRACNARFMRRFKRLEELAYQENIDLQQIDDKSVWRQLWDRAKEDVAHLEK